MSILLIHGVGGRPRSWDSVLTHLDPVLRRQADAVDLTVATGQSVADAARDVLDCHPGSHVVVGHSFGGMLAQEIALTDRERVRGLVLISTIPGSTPRVTAINLALAADIEADGLENVAEAFAASLIAPERFSARPDVVAAFVSAMLDAGITSVCAALRAIADWDATGRLGSLHCPAAVVAGSAEPDLDRQALLAQRIGASFEVLDGTGHLAPLEAPGDVARIITAMASTVK